MTCPVWVRSDWQERHQMGPCVTVRELGLGLGLSGRSQKAIRRFICCSDFHLHFWSWPPHTQVTQDQYPSAKHLSCLKTVFPHHLLFPLQVGGPDPFTFPSRTSFPSHFLSFPLGHSSWIVSSFSVSFEKRSNQDGMCLPESLTGKHNKMTVSPSLEYSCFLLHSSITAGCFFHRKHDAVGIFPSTGQGWTPCLFHPDFYLLVSSQLSHELAHFGPRAR